VLFFASLRFSQSLREFVLSLDLRLIAGMQAWRWAGLGFLSLYAQRVLPAVFALPAGLGDMAIGVTAPWIILALVRQPGFAAGGTFIGWNVLGVLDLIIAISIGTVSNFFATGAAGEISTAPMAMLPLLLIPAFLVPLFLMLHAAALMQSRQLRRSRIQERRNVAR
jgi:membrane protein implicated in regulation of membrane protease activity